MRRSGFFLVLMLGAVSLKASQPTTADEGMAWKRLSGLPAAVTNNAVAGLKFHGRTLIYSFMGLGPEKTSASITREAYVYDPRTQAWKALPHVPGENGRIAAAAVGVYGRVYLFGGYTVDEHGREETSSSVDIFNPVSSADLSRGYWSKGLPMPVSLDDSVALPYADRFVIFISGWSNDKSVNNVMIYDTVRNHWSKTTALMGTPVFGHAGAISGGTIVYCGGAYRSQRADGPKYLPTEECWMGKIRDPWVRKIQWTLISSPSHKPIYRVAAGAWKDRVVFAGGTTNPYNYDGIGYNSVASEPSGEVYAFNVHRKTWQMLTPMPVPSMDHRSLVKTDTGLAVVGGMEEGQKVSSGVYELDMPK